MPCPIFTLQLVRNYLKLHYLITKICGFLDADPNNYMSYYKRATVFLALSRSRPALSDLDKVIQLKSDFQAVSHNILLHEIHKSCIDLLPIAGPHPKRQYVTENGQIR